jgi:hypothetical protein
MNYFFYSIISFSVALFFIVLGVMGIIISWSIEVRNDLIQFIQRDSLLLPLFGLAFMFIGIAIAAYILINAKRKYYHIRSGNNAIKVDETIIQQYLDAYWKELFPGNDIPSRLTLKNNKIYITADFPNFPLAQQQLILERVKHDLRNTFAEMLGYHDEFYLSSSFRQ